MPRTSANIDTVLPESAMEKGGLSEGLEEGKVEEQVRRPHVWNTWSQKTINGTEDGLLRVMLPPFLVLIPYPLEAIMKTYSPSYYLPKGNKA